MSRIERYRKRNAKLARKIKEMANQSLMDLARYLDETKKLRKKAKELERIIMKRN